MVRDNTMSAEKMTQKNVMGTKPGPRGVFVPDNSFFSFYFVLLSIGDVIQGEW